MIGREDLSLQEVLENSDSVHVLLLYNKVYRKISSLNPIDFFLFSTLRYVKSMKGRRLLKYFQEN